MQIKENELIVIELNEFKFLFNNFTVGLKDLESLEEEITVLDLLNHYRIKTLPKKVRNRLNTAKINNFKVFKTEGQDLRFVAFSIDERTLKLIKEYFRGSDRAFRKYKVEFSKKERSLLWKLKNTGELLPDHRNEVDTREAMDLNSIIRELPEYEEFENEKQTKPSEYEVQMEIKRKNAKKASQKQKLTIWNNRWKLLGMPDIKTICKSKKEIKKPDTEFLKNSVEVKQGGLVYNGLGEIKRAG